MPKKQLLLLAISLQIDSLFISKQKEILCVLCLNRRKVMLFLRKLSSSSAMNSLTNRFVTIQIYSLAIYVI